MTLTLILILTVLMIWVMITDLTRYLIPNRLVLCILALYPVMLLCSNSRPEWYWDIAIGIAFLLGGFAIFAFRLMGAGDIKLMAACGPFLGKTLALPFLMYVALWGGALAIGLIMGRELAPFIWMKLGKSAESLPRVLTAGQPAPYGVAIAIAFLILLWGGQIPGLVL